MKPDPWLARSDFNLHQTKCPHCSYFSKLTSAPVQLQMLERLQLQTVKKQN